MIFLLALTAIPFLFTIANSLTMRVVRARSAQTINASVSILVPMRNEERNVDAVVSALLKSTSLTNSELIVLDDNSDDATAQLLVKYPGIAVHSGIALPDGWLGKNFACHQLVTHSTGEYLVFVDADVRLAPEAIAAAITYMNELGWDFISPYPREIAETFIERMIQPLLQWSWLSSVPLRFAEKGKFASMIIANGQFMVIKRSAYLATGGHKAIRQEVLDDLELARLLVKNGFKGGVADGSDVASCRMYQNGNDLASGYTKSLWRAFGSPLGSLLTVIFLFATGVLPQILAQVGFTVGWVGYLLLVLSRYIAAWRTQSSMRWAILHPLSILMLIFLIAWSWQKKLTHQLVWRGRSVA